MGSSQQSGELHIGYARLTDQEYRRELGDNMQYKPVLDAKISRLVDIIKADQDADFVSAWVKFDFWEGRLWVSLGD